MKCQLATGFQRRIVDCNYNQHYLEKHADRCIDFHDLIYVLEGEWEIYQDETPYLLHKGDLLLLSAGHHHYGLEPCTQRVKTIYVHFDASEHDECGDDFTHNGNAFLLPTHLSVPADTQVPYLLKSLLTAYWEKSSYASEKASAYLSLLLCEITRISSGEALFVDKKELVNRMLRTIAANPNRFYSINELCELIHVSRKTLHNYFFQTTGMAPHAYQLKRKLNHAKRRLEKNPTQSLDEIVAYYGFCDEYHFSKQFKKEFGQSPKQYAKLYISTQDNSFLHSVENE